MNYAILLQGGHQYQIQEGKTIAVEKIDGKTGDTLTLDQLLLIVKDKQRTIGTPYIKNASVKAKIVEQTKDKKIRVATYKAKARQRKVIGHRKHITKILIEKINTK